MYVVIGKTVAYEQLTMQVGSSLYGVDGISLAILLGRTHISLSIDGVVVFPVGRRSHRDTTGKHSPALAHRHQRTESTEAPSPDGDIVLVNIRLIAQIDGCLHLVASLEIAKAEIDGFLKISTSATSTSTIYAYHYAALAGEIVVEESTRAHASDAP